MLLTELILAKRGPLAKVWLSAHHERKLSKQQALGVDVGESVEAILTQDDGPTTLRLSGQLMLGVTRIYSRQAQYLLDDCKETRERISLAFRPGVVDLPEDQIRANKNAITFTETRDFDNFDWNFTALESAPRGLHTAPITKTNLKPLNGEFGAYNFGRQRAASIYGSTPSRHGSVSGDESHLDSQDFGGVDLGLSFDGRIGSEYGSIEAGRRAGSVIGSIRSGFGGEMRRKDGTRGPYDDEGPSGNYEPIDLGFDFDAPLGDFDALPGLEEDRARRETSALSTPPPTSPTGDISMTEITPRTAARVAHLADAHDRAAPSSAPRAKKLRLLTADDELELADEDFAAPREDSALLGSPSYIPPDSNNPYFRDYDSPEDHFLPTIKVGNETMFYAGPEGLAPELAELFTFPQHVLRRHRGADEEEVAPAAKRARVRAEEEDEIEAGRRGSVLPVDNMDFNGGVDDSFQMDMGGGGFDDPLAGAVFETPRKAQRRREPSLAPSRAESIAREVQFSNPDHPLAVFDSRFGARAEESQSLNTPSKSSLANESVARTAGGFSKNTGMAMGLLRREIDKIEADLPRDERTLEFETLAEKSTKRAAATFFFELLVLGTKDVIKVDQKKGFGDIEVRGKDKLWEQIAA